MKKAIKSLKFYSTTVPNCGLTVKNIVTNVKFISYFFAKKEFIDDICINARSVFKEIFFSK